MHRTNDEQWMMRAIMLASSGHGRTWPNPSVGCVIVRDNILIGEGQTSPRGRPHAETNALRAVAGSAEAAEVYVTLEPCAHQGQTPPCAYALIEARVRRVFVAALDPDPRVNGRGLELLRAAGIDVVTGLCAAEANVGLRGFFHKLATGRPLVISGSCPSKDDGLRADAVLTSDQELQHIEGLAECGALAVRVPSSHDASQLLDTLGAHGLTSVYVHRDDPLAKILERRGLVDDIG
ncbi:MAG: bifunctional diaminohydroxyphosphoribosylaminopyrimidine deaminase/5-amino-6-(5-phosphoribosylamino)uracil reductase RibD [Nannocystaceae bacterium]